MGEFVWKTLWENDSRPFIIQKEIFLKEIYLSMVLLGLGLGGGVLNEVINPAEILDSEAQIFGFGFGTLNFWVFCF